MAGWNKPSAANQPTVKKGGAKAPSAMRGVIVGAIAVAIGAVCLWMFSGGEEAPKAKPDKERGRIKEVTPAAAPKAVEEAPKVEKPKKPWWETNNTNGFTDAMIRKWKFERQPKPAWTNTAMASSPPQKYEIFETHAENEIACYLTLEPGQSLVGLPVYGKKFSDEFLKSCETPIIVDKDDDEYTASLKRLMVQTKIELRQRMADGEDLGQILLDTRKEMQRLAQVKREIEGSLRDVIKTSGVQSEEEVDTYLEAANKMLEEKGIAPIKANPFTRHALFRSLQKAQQ